MNTSSLIIQVMPLRKQSFGLTANAAPWKTSSKRRRMAFILIRQISSSFLENHARMMVSLLAYNIVTFMRTLCFTNGSAIMQVDTIRLRLFKFAGKLIRTGRRLLLKLSSYHVYQELFYQVLGNIQQLCW